ncbi:MAG: ribose transport system substrate-binding protein [Solirubrobacteraceae bacterium]|nr:ribose transport system substrate-binding protein [Solirubrobacteraceae bacterium]
MSGGKWRISAAIATACVAMATFTACGSGDDSSSAGGSGGGENKEARTTGEALKVGGQKGPNGEVATPITDIKVTDEDVAKIKAGKFTAAIVWHEFGTDLPRAMTAGMRKRFGELGIKIVAITSAEFDAAKQNNDIESVLGRKPSVIMSIPVDAESSASAFRQALDRGTKIVFLGNPPKKFVHGKDYIAVMASDEAMLGNWAAKILGDSMGGKGKVGMVFYDADFYVTNQRDQAFREAMKRDYPGIEIVAESGFHDPKRVEAVAGALITRYPDIKGIYTTWAEPAEQVLAALRQAGRKDIKVSTIDLSQPLALDMAHKGQTLGMSANRIFDLGVAAANAAGLGLIGKPGPEYAITSSIAVTRDNLLEAWKTSYGTEAPKAVRDAMAAEGS